MSRLASRVATGLTLAAAVLALLWLDGRFAPGRLALGIVTALACAAAWELQRMGSFRGRGLALPLYAAALACAALVGLVLHAVVELRAELALALLYPCAGGCAGLALALTGAHARQAVPLALWLFPPLFALVLVDRELGPRGLFALVFLAKIGDNAGFFVGRAIGRRHPFPHISPGKTVAGCAASFAAGTVAGAIVLPLTVGERTLAEAALGALIGAGVNVAAQAGDLSESWVKRRAGVKDSSPLLGPSGGVLDAIDSLLLAAPLALLLFVWAYGP